MKKFKKVLGIAFAALFTLFTFFSNAPVQAANKSKAQIIPQIQFVNTPTTEYAVGDRVRFDISAPNYGGKVEYRVVLWNDSTKSYSDLWNSTNGYPNRYYTKWQPWGGNVFTLGWPIFEPGNYRITVYAKRVGISNDKTFLKGQNCDSFKESVAFTVKTKVSNLDKEGQTYGSNDINKLEVVKNDVNVTAKNVTFSNAKVEGNINITGDNAVIKNVNATGKIVINPGKDGSTSLENVVAKQIEVLSGGQNSIHIKNVQADSMAVNSTSPVRVEADGYTKIVSTTANGYVIFDKKSGTFGTITITKSAQGETVVEFRGDIQDNVVVETPATIKTAEGSNIQNLFIATENSTDKVALEGRFINVEVSKPAMVEIGASTTVNSVEVKANAEITVVKGAVVQTLDTNNNTVGLDNNGTIINQESTADIGSGGGGVYIPPAQVTNENKDFNAAVNAVINDMNKYSLSNSVFGTINNLPVSGKTNTIGLTFKAPYNTLNFETIFAAAKDRIVAHGILTEQKDITTIQDMSYLLENVIVNGTPIKTLVGLKLSAMGKTRTADFINDMTPENYNALLGALISDPTLGSYDNIIAVLHALIPGEDVVINELLINGLTVQNIKIGNSTIYNYSGSAAEKTITVSEIRTALGLSTDAAVVKTQTPHDIGSKTIVITLKGESGTIYTYNISVGV